jgi:hypothetical protein
MAALGTLLTWVCAAIVALPLAPCAFIASACHHGPADAAATSQPARSCCAQHSEPAAPDSDQPREKPCSGECCKLSPYVPPLEKVALDAHPLALVAVLPALEDAVAATSHASDAALPPPGSLQILHCQWSL